MVDGNIIAWAKSEFGGAGFGDIRRLDRFLMIMCGIARNVGGAISMCCDKVGAQAVSRFLGRKEVTIESILKSHIEQTAKRCEGMERILVVQDTTDIDLSGHKKLEGIGPICQSLRVMGLKMHTAMAVGIDKKPIGVVSIDCWARNSDTFGTSGTTKKKKPVDKKESRKWIVGLKNAEAALPLGLPILVIGDRESDIFMLFVVVRLENTDILVRVCHNRGIEDEEHIGSSLFIMDSILDWQFLLTSLKENRTTSVERIWRFLNQQCKEQIENWTLGSQIDDSLKLSIVERFNEILDKVEFFDSEAFKELEMTKEGEKFLKEGLEKLDESDLQRFNRLIFESVYPRQIAKSQYKYIFEALDMSPVLGEYLLEVPRQGGQKPRKAKMQVKTIRATIKPPRNRTPDIPDTPVSLTYLTAEEIDAPEGVTPLKWTLMTTLSVETFEEAVYCIEAYACRWVIEEFHRVLKEGCRVESLQLETLKRMLPAIAMFSIVAWRILYISKWSRSNPDASVHDFASKNECIALSAWLKMKRKPSEIRSVNDFVRGVAILGGFMARKSDGEPGAKKIWEGFRRLAVLVEGYEAALMMQSSR
jgi:hypothetical protein